MKITHDPEIPERKGPSKKLRSFEDLLKELRPQLEKLPTTQRIPSLPPDQLVLNSVEEFVRSSGMVVPDTCPPTVALAGEFLDRCQLREGRVGLHGNFRVVCFLYQFSDKSLRSIVIIPRDGIDARFLGMAIFWGLVADIPESIAQSKVLDLKEFFKINTFDLSKLVDIAAIERFKIECKKMADIEISQFHGSFVDFRGRIARLESDLKSSQERERNLEQGMTESSADSVKEYNRAETWRLVAVVALITCVLFLMGSVFSHG